MLRSIETIANTLGRPFGLDFYFELSCRPAMVGEYEWGVHRSTGKLDASELWLGPLHFAVCRK